MGSCFDFAEKKAKVIIFISYFSLITIEWYKLSKKIVKDQPVMD